MKHNVFTRLLAVLLLATLLLCSFVACNKEGNEDEKDEPKHIDYVSELKLDMNSNRAKIIDPKVHIYIDGDTTHFKIPTSVIPEAEGILKARYISINTPESTGRIEPWGKAASNFTRAALEKATSIVLESDTSTWNADSTGGRYLVWVWYKTADMTDYRNLNLEILQNGLAIASNSGENSYGEICMKAINQAQSEKLCVYSPEKDPNFHYGAAQEMTLKELRSNIESYNGSKVAFEGVISAIFDGSFYVEEYNEELGICQGISVYYETAGLPGAALENISVGNRVRVVGSVTYFEPGNIWQVSGLSYSLMKPDDPANFKLISKDNTVAFTEVSLSDFLTKKVSVTVGEDGSKEFNYAEIVIDTSISMKDLTVTGSRTNDKGEVTLYCSNNGLEISLFLGAMTDAENNPVSGASFEGEIVDAKGIVDEYYGKYQIRVLTINDITIH